MQELQEINLLLIGIGKTLDDLQGHLDAKIFIPVLIETTIKKINAEILESIRLLIKLEETKKNVAEIARYRLTLKTFCTLLHTGLKNAKDPKYYGEFLYSSEGQKIVSFINTSDPEIVEENVSTLHSAEIVKKPVIISPRSPSITRSILGMFGNTTKAIASTFAASCAAIIASILIVNRNDISPKGKFAFFGLIAGVFVIAKIGINKYVDEDPSKIQKNFRWKG